MARLAGKVVSTVTYDLTGESIDIRLLKNPMRFRAEAGEGGARESFEDKDGDTVSAWALDALKRNAIMEWQPVIELFMPESRFEAKEGVLFDYRRFYIGRAPKAWRQVPWDRFDAEEPIRMADAITELVLKDNGNRNSGMHRPEDFDGTLPYYSHLVEDGDYDWEEDLDERARMVACAKRGVLLAYDEATWSVIVEIGETLRRARAKVVSLIERPEDLAALAGGCVSREFLAITA